MQCCFYISYQVKLCPIKKQTNQLINKVDRPQGQIEVLLNFNMYEKFIKMAQVERVFKKPNKLKQPPSYGNKGYRIDKKTDCRT